MRCSPRPVSSRGPGLCGAGAALPRVGDRAQHGPGWSRPSRIGRRGPVSPDPGRRAAACWSSAQTPRSRCLCCALPCPTGAEWRQRSPWRRGPIRDLRRARVAIRGRQAQRARAGSVMAASCCAPVRPSPRPVSASAGFRRDRCATHHRPVNVIAPAEQARARRGRGPRPPVPPGGTADGRSGERAARPGFAGPDSGRRAAGPGNNPADAPAWAAAPGWGRWRGTACGSHTAPSWSSLPMHQAGQARRAGRGEPPGGQGRQRGIDREDAGLRPDGVVGRAR